MRAGQTIWNVDAHCDNGKRSGSRAFAASKVKVELASNERRAAAVPPTERIAGDARAAASLGAPRSPERCCVPRFTLGSIFAPPKSDFNKQH
jgi:hypothetical protein